MGVEDKIDKMYDMLVEVIAENRETKSEQSQHRKELDDHRKELNILTEHKNKLIGKIAMFSLFIGSIFSLLGAWVAKKFQ